MVSLLSTVHSTVPAQGSKTPKPLLRRGTIRKADDALLDAENPSVPSSPTKRARVSFNPEVEEKIMEVFTPKARSLESIRAEVRRSIEAHQRGDSEGYDNMKKLFIPRRGADRDQESDEEGQDDEKDIRTYLVALTGYASLLNKKCDGLVHAILSCEWMGRDEIFVKTYVQFLGSLVSAHGVFLGEVLEMLVKYFQGSRLSSGRLLGYPDVNREQMASRVHVALKYLLRLIPSASGLLSAILVRKYPDIEESTKVHLLYIRNLIQLTEYATELKSDIFALITSELVKIDVHMQVDLDDLDDETAATIVQAISMSSSSKLEDHNNNDSDSDEDSVTSEDELNSDAKRIKDVQASVEKMDAILDLLFATYTPYFLDPNSVEAGSMFETLLGHFVTIILRNYRSRHTQFLLFHFAQTADHLIDQFAGTCFQLAFQAGQPAIFKQSSAAYLASFVARGAHVQPHVVRTVFELIGSNLDVIRATNEVTCRGPDLKRYGTFYSMTQALLYIFCFRWRDLITSSDILEDDDPIAFVGQDLNWQPGIKETLSKAIYSKLNPLKICSPPIVAEFAKIAHHLRFLYVYPLLETNKRIRLSQFSSSKGALRDAGSGGVNESWHQLESYFPFDPYQLPVSKRWVESDYVQWKGVPGLKQDEEEDDSTDEEDDEDNEDLDLEEDDTGDEDE